MKFLKNRFLLGSLCIILAILIGFFAVPLALSITNQKVEVVIASTDIPSKTAITGEMLVIKEMFESDIPSGAGLVLEDIVGKYSQVDISENDVITKQKLTVEFPYSDEELYDLPPSKMAVSITTPTLSSTIAGKLKAGDIVTVLISKKVDSKEETPTLDSNMAHAYNELLYMLVLNVTTNEGDDIAGPTSNTNLENSAADITIPGVVTLLCNIDQARLLANFEFSSDIHLALVARNNSPMATDYLERQDEYFEEYYRLKAESEEAEDLADEEEDEDEFSSDDLIIRDDEGNIILLDEEGNPTYDDDGNPVLVDPPEEEDDEEDDEETEIAESSIASKPASTTSSKPASTATSKTASTTASKPSTSSTTKAADTGESEILVKAPKKT